MANRPRRPLNNYPIPPCVAFKITRYHFARLVDQIRISSPSIYKRIIFPVFLSSFYPSIYTRGGAGMLPPRDLSDPNRSLRRQKSKFRLFLFFRQALEDILVWQDLQLRNRQFVSVTRNSCFYSPRRLAIAIRAPSPTIPKTNNSCSHSRQNRVHK